MSSLNLLLVDDDREFVAIMARRLRERGLTVSCALSGREAIDRLASEDTIDVVVLDVQMPRFDGMQTIEAVKQQHPLVEISCSPGMQRFRQPSQR